MIGHIFSQYYILVCFEITSTLERLPKIFTFLIRILIIKKLFKPYFIPIWPECGCGFHPPSSSKVGAVIGHSCFFECLFHCCFRYLIIDFFTSEIALKIITITFTLTLTLTLILTLFLNVLF